MGLKEDLTRDLLDKVNNFQRKTSDRFSYLWEQFKDKLPFDDTPTDYRPYFFDYYYDGCSFNVTLNWNYIGIRFPTLQNTLWRSNTGKCALPNPQQPDIEKDYVGTNCDISCAIGFFVVENFDEPPRVEKGAGFFAHNFTEAESPRYIEYPDYGYDPLKQQAYFPNQPNLMGIFKYSGYLIDEEDKSTGKGGTVWYYPTSYSKEELKKTGGIIDTSFLPDYKLDGTIVKPPWKVLGLVKYNCDNSERLPPPPPPKPKCKCMCCPQQKDLEPLLRLILKRIGNLPATVPQDLTDHSKGLRTINSLTEYQAQQIRLLDCLFGQFPIKIKIEDADLTQEGNQERIIEVPNLAETLTELLGLCMSISNEGGASLDVSMRTLQESSAAKISAIKALRVAESNMEFLGYKVKEVEEEIASTFDPSKEKLDEMLKETKVKIPVFENDEKKSLLDNLQPLLLMARRWTAQNVRVLSGDIGQTLKQVLVSSGLLPKLAKDLINKEQGKNEDGTPKPPKQDDFSTFLENVENGFGTIAGIPDSTKPYGKPYDNRPRIRELGNSANGGEEA